MNRTDARDNYRKRLLTRSDADDGEDEAEGEAEHTEQRRRRRPEATAEPKTEEYKGVHGNTRLPYGLCKGRGIDTTGMKPRQAWDALRGYGIKPTDVFQYVEEHGSLDGFDNDENTKKKEGPESNNIEAKEEPKKGVKEEPETESEKEPEEEPQEEPKEEPVETPKAEPVKAEEPKAEEPVETEPVKPTEQGNNGEEAVETSEQGPKITPEQKEMLDYYREGIKHWMQAIDKGSAKTKKGYSQLVYEQPSGNWNRTILLENLQHSKDDEAGKKLATSLLFSKSATSCVLDAQYYFYSLQRHWKKGEIWGYERQKLEDNLHGVEKALREYIDKDTEPELAGWVQKKLDEIKPQADELLSQINEAQEKLKQENQAAQQALEDKFTNWAENPHCGKAEIRQYQHFDNFEDAQNYISKELGIKDVNYKQLQDYMKRKGYKSVFNGRPWWNSVNDVLMSIFDNFGIKPDSILINNRCSDTMASWTYGKRILTICATESLMTRAEHIEHDKERKKYWEDQTEWYRKMYQKDLAEGKTYYAKNVDLPNLKKVQHNAQVYADDIEIRHNVFDDDYLVESLITHEMGHAMMGVWGRNSEFRRAHELKLREAILAHGDVDKISRYSVDKKDYDGGEAFAECFAMYMMPNERDKLPDYAKEIVEDAIKQTVEKMKQQYSS